MSLIGLPDVDGESAHRDESHESDCHQREDLP
jgi:hypothetical protein